MAETRERRSRATRHEDAPQGKGDGADALEPLKRAATAAAVAALAAGLAGAARAALGRRSDAESDDDQSEDEPDGEPARDEVSGARAEEATAAEDHEREREPESTPEQPQDDEERQPADERAAHPSREERGAKSAEVAKIVQRARSQVEELLGSPAESVSALERVNGTWYVTLEVLELRRIPDSTDVLSSYEVVLDDGGDLIRLDRRRRYRRAQVEDDG